MATELWVELVCAVCATAGPGQFTYDQRLPRKELKKDAKGWHFRDDEVYCSRKCLKESGNE